MRRLLPRPAIDGIDALGFYTTLSRPVPADRPWVMVNMIASADGAVAVGGTSEALGNPSDQAVFSAVRACADWIVVAAGTARVEAYAVPRPRAAVRRARVATGRLQRPRLAVVSSSLDFDLSLPMFADRRPGDDVPVIITGEEAPPGAVSRLAAVAEVTRLEGPRPDPQAILAELRRRGARVVLCEGGPSLNAQFADAETIDELCLSVAPLLVGGASPRIVQGSRRASPLPMQLTHLLAGDDTMFARYLVSSSRPPG